MERRTHILLAIVALLLAFVALSHNVSAVIANGGGGTYYIFKTSGGEHNCVRDPARAIYSLDPGECVEVSQDTTIQLYGCDSRGMTINHPNFSYVLSWNIKWDVKAQKSSGSANVVTTTPEHARLEMDMCTGRWCVIQGEEYNDGFSISAPQYPNYDEDFFRFVPTSKTWGGGGYTHGYIKICYFPTMELCTDGTEILESPVRIDPDGFASATGITTTSEVQIRYTLIVTGEETISGDITLQDDPVLWSFPFSYYPQISGTTIITSIIPPSRALPLSPVGGENYAAYFEIGNLGESSFSLVSVCLIKPRVHDYCPDGHELLISEDIFMPRLGEPFDFYGVIPYSDYQLRFRLLNPTPDGTSIYAAVQANSGSWSLEGNPGEEIITRTIPTRGTISGANLDLEVTNTYDDFYLQSICAIERVPLPEFTCDYFYDFKDGISGWEQSPGTGANWASDEEDGALRILGDGQGGDATVLTYVERGAWEMVMSARSYASPTNVIYGFVGAQFPYTDSLRTSTLTEEYAQLRATGIVSGYAKIQTQHAYVDWICLVNHDKSSEIPMLPVPTCGVFPTFEDHPDFSITEIGNWIYWAINKILDIMKWLVCQIVAAVNTAANWIIKQIAYVFGKLNLPEFPEIPDNLFDLSAWMEWMRQSASVILSWIYRQIRNAFESVVNIASWAGRWWGSFAEWLASWWIYGLNLIVEHFLALFGIEIDPMALWRDFKIFIDAVGEEIGYEFDSLLLLLNDVGEVFGIVFTGWWGSLSGDATQDFGQGMGGLGGFIWRGVEWVGEAIDGTPLTALNFVSMGALAWGLFTHTTEKISKIFSRLFSLSSD